MKSASKIALLGASFALPLVIGRLVGSESQAGSRRPVSGRRRRPVSGRRRPAKQPAVVWPSDLNLPPDLPLSPGAEREQWFLDRITAGAFTPPEWSSIESIGQEGTPAEGYRLVVPVFADALKIPISGYDIRFTPNFETWQKAADSQGWQLLTPHLADLRFQAATTVLDPFAVTHPQWVEDGSMSDTTRMVEHSLMLDQLIEEKKHKTGIIGNLGKLWVVTALFGWPGVSAYGIPYNQGAANYGLFLSDGEPIQQFSGFGHRASGHTDYSQLGIAAAETGQLFGPDNSVATVQLRDLFESDLASLATGKEGQHPYWHHPSIEIP